MVNPPPDSLLTAEDADKIISIVAPQSFKALKELRDQKGRLVHYTSADSARKIICSGELWLRGTSAMHDYSEMQFGHNKLLSALAADGERLFNLLRSECSNIHQGSLEGALGRFGFQAGRIFSETYVACFSRHLDGDEDEHGRLSMWRTFSKDTVGVAIVLKTPSAGTAARLRALLLPVQYCDDNDFQQQIKDIVEQVVENRVFLRHLTPQVFENFLYLMFLMFSVAVKHKGFKEECEWRVVHCPYLFDAFPENPHINIRTETVAGVPQTVHVLALNNRNGVDGMELRQLIDRVIIGPSQYGRNVAEAISRELKKANVENPNVVTSGIPLRG